MNASHPAPRRAPAREGSRQRRLLIIDAALAVMRREGLRAVTHRAVAREAGVPLAATTYYFADLEELITESFLHWSASQREVIEALHAQVMAVAGSAAAGDPGADPVDRIAGIVAEYLAGQVGRLRGDRVLEYAFLHEALRLPRLREAVETQQQALLGFLADFHAATGSPYPALDAQISHSVLLGLEKSELLAGRAEPDEAGMRAVLRRYLQAGWPARGG